MRALSVLFLGLVVPLAQAQAQKPPPPKPPMPPTPPPHHHHHHFPWWMMQRPIMPVIIPSMPTPSYPSQASNYPYYPSNYGQNYGQGSYGTNANSLPQNVYSPTPSGYELPAPSATKGRVQITLPTSAA